MFNINNNFIFFLKIVIVFSAFPVRLVLHVLQIENHWSTHHSITYMYIFTYLFFKLIRKSLQVIEKCWYTAILRYLSSPDNCFCGHYNLY